MWAEDYVDPEEGYSKATIVVRSADLLKLRAAAFVNGLTSVSVILDVNH